MFTGKERTRVYRCENSYKL